MSISLPQITVVGTLTGDPDLKFVGQGTAVANFTIASNSRKYDKASGNWVEGDTTFLQAVAWKDLAENIAESLTKGHRVVATGVLKQESWEKDGQKRSTLKLEVDEIGPSLKWAVATVTKAGKKAASAPQGDPWGGSPDW